MVRPGAQGFGVGVVDEHGLAAGGVAAVDIAPAIADHVAGGEFDPAFRGGAEEHAGGGLAEFRGLVAGVPGDFDAVEGQFAEEESVHGFHGFTGLSAAADIGLVGGDNEKKAVFAQEAAGFGDAGEDIEFGERLRRKRLAVAHFGAVEDAVAIEKDGAARERRGGLNGIAQFTYNCRLEAAAWEADCGARERMTSANFAIMLAREN